MILTLPLHWEKATLYCALEDNKGILLARYFDGELGYDVCIDMITFSKERG